MHGTSQERAISDDRLEVVLPLGVAFRKIEAELCALGLQESYMLRMTYIGIL